MGLFDICSSASRNWQIVSTFNITLSRYPNRQTLIFRFDIDMIRLRYPGGTINVELY